MVRYYLRLWVFKRPIKGICRRNAPVRPRRSLIISRRWGECHRQLKDFIKSSLLLRKKCTSHFTNNVAG